MNLRKYKGARNINGINYCWLNNYYSSQATGRFKYYFIADRHLITNGISSELL